MENISQSTILFAICLFFISACVKNNNSTKVNSVITLSKSGIERGEQVFATTNAQNSNSIIKWTVNPSASVQILPANSHATAIFGFAGTYQITASYYSPSDTLVVLGSSNAIIKVANSIFSPSLSNSSTDTVSLQNDQIIISPISASDSGFIFSAQTSNLYNCSAYIIPEALGWWGPLTSPSLGFYFNSGKVVEGKFDCDGVRNPAISYIFLPPVSNGTYPVLGNINHVDYSGSLTVTNTDYTFTWNYTSGIIISPLHIQKR